MRNNGKSCPHLILAHLEDVDEAMPREARYMCQMCKKTFDFTFSDETYWDVQEYV